MIAKGLAIALGLLNFRRKFKRALKKVLPNRLRAIFRKFFEGKPLGVFYF